MKVITALLASLVLFSSPTPPQDSAPAKKDPAINDLAWIAGAWEGSVGAAQLEEHWTKPGGKTMIGMGRTIIGDRTVQYEYLRIEERKTGIVYIASPNGAKPTEFKLTKFGAESVTFENPQHDNPKVITYRKTKDGLSARIDGDEGGEPVSQDFTFTRMKS
jgi:Domain of unknown function (DUF6265)